MKLQQSFYIQDFHYKVRLQEGDLSFALLNPPRRLLRHNRDAWLHFWDEDHFEDVSFQVPVWQVLRHVVGIVRAWLQRYRIAYFSFAASTPRKIAVYERLLQRHLPDHYAYTQQDNVFYVYAKQDG